MRTAGVCFVTAVGVVGRVIPAPTYVNCDELSSTTGFVLLPAPQPHYNERRWGSSRNRRCARATTSARALPNSRSALRSCRCASLLSCSSSGYPRPHRVTSTCTGLTRAGLLVRPHRHAQQALPSGAEHHARALVRAASRVLWRVPARVAGPRQLAAAALGVQGRLHLGPVSVRHGRAADLAVPRVPLVWRVLRGHVCHREWAGELGDGGESVS